MGAERFFPKFFLFLSFDRGNKFSEKFPDPSQELSSELLGRFHISFDWEPYKDAMADFQNQCVIREYTKGNRKTNSAEVTPLKDDVTVESSAGWTYEISQLFLFSYVFFSGRLHLSSYACALGIVYSFGPRFKAHTSHSPKQANEAWKVEAEIAFSELQEAMECAIDYLKFLCKWIIDSCSEDMKFILKRIDKSAIDCLQSLISDEYEKISYAQAVEFLKQFTVKKFEVEVEWVTPSSDEHESFLADEIYKKPVIIYNHPKEMKPFYVRLNDDGQTVASFDILAPKRVILEGNPYLQVVTMAVSVFHSLIDFLAFKNDIKFWNKNGEGLWL